MCQRSMSNSVKCLDVATVAYRRSLVVDPDCTVRWLRVLDVRSNTGAVDVVFVYWYW